MVNVTPTPSPDEDDNLSSYMEMSHFAHDDDFILVVHRSSQLMRSSNDWIPSN